ncbi:dual specificity protein phosphatase 14 [Parasteatoda tepidariorum]|uniref:dual specificity protein phosphatase 14 n=1 Tax=Parasteatoda tepidariorum TaxID=114398 RepID=UPI00077F9537|nr:dual specificity protein phosphatase 14 [Parasteatoda tepidariorum]
MLCGLNEVNDHLFISSARSVTDSSLQQTGITCVINCSLTPPSYSTGHLRYWAIAVEDNERANISCYFDEVADLIHQEQLIGGKVLVYCMAGISRSASLCLAYLMKYENLNLRSAFRLLRSRRPMVHPNNGFFQQLIDYERDLYHQTSVQMVRVPNAVSADCIVPDVFYEVARGMVWLKSCQENPTTKK